MDDGEAETPEHLAVVVQDVTVVAGDDATVAGGVEGGNAHPDVAALAGAGAAGAEGVDLAMEGGELGAVIPEDGVAQIGEALGVEGAGAVIATTVHAVHGENDLGDVGDGGELLQHARQGGALELGIKGRDDKGDGLLQRELLEQGLALVEGGLGEVMQRGE